MTKAGKKETPKRVKKLYETNCRNEMKESGTMRQSKSTKTSRDTSRVKDLQSPETKAAERHLGQQ